MSARLPRLALPTVSGGMPLSIARATSLDKALLDHLEALSIRGYFLVYGVRETRWSRVRRFFLYDWPAAVRSVWKETIIISLIILLGALTSYSLVASNPEWYYNFVGEDMAGGRDPRATAFFNSFNDQIARLPATIQGDVRAFYERMGWRPVWSAERLRGLQTVELEAEDVEASVAAEEVVSGADNDV